MTWPLSNSRSYELNTQVENNKEIDLIASFLKMKVPRGQSYVIEPLAPTEFEYKLIESAFVATGTPQFDK